MKEQSVEETSEPWYPSALLDFVRVVALAGVVLYHATKQGIGWQGVHVFLVLSGFGLAVACRRRSVPLTWGQ